MLSPGPANLVSFVLGARNGVRRILPFQSGVFTVYAAFTICLGSLTTRIAMSSPGAAQTAQFLGGLFIVYLGGKLIYRRGRKVDDRPPTFTNGVVLQTLNPKFPGVVIAIFSSRSDEPALATTAVVLSVGALGLLGYGLAGSVVRTRAASTDDLRGLDLAAGVSLVLVGLWFFTRPLFG